MRARLLPIFGPVRDGKRHWIALFTAFSLTLLACNDVKFEKPTEAQNIDNPPGPTGSTPCSDIGGSFPSNENGMYGWIIVQTPSVCQGSSNLSCNSFEEMTSGSQGDKLSDMVVSAPIVRTLDFSAGFTTRNGGKLNYRGTNTPVVEFWGLNMRTKIALMPGEGEGYYQFLALVDDGFQIKREDSGEILLNLDGLNPTTVVSNDSVNNAPKTLYLRAGERIPFRIQYYQTPKNEIAFYMMWRKVNSPAEATNARFNRCAGNVCGRNQFWNVDAGGTPTPNYQALEADGWRPMRQENFWMPDSLVHSCQ